MEISPRLASTCLGSRSDLVEAVSRDRVATFQISAFGDTSHPDDGRGKIWQEVPSSRQHSSFLDPDVTSPWRAAGEKQHAAIILP